MLCSLVGLPVVRGMELASRSLVTEGLEVIVGTLDVEGSDEGVLSVVAGSEKQQGSSS